MMPLDAPMVAHAIRTAWTATRSARSAAMSNAAHTFIARQYVHEHLPIRGRRVWIAQAHIMRAWTPSEIAGSDDIEAYVVNAHAGRMN